MVTGWRENGQGGNPVQRRITGLERVAEQNRVVIELVKEETKIVEGK
jgi:hypothetical protein